MSSFRPFGKNDTLVRRRCYQFLERELDYEGTLKGNCHDGLTIASWILDDWPARLHWLTHQLGLAAPEQCLGHRKRLGTDDRELLRHLLRMPRSSRAEWTEGGVGRS